MNDQTSRRGALKCLGMGAGTLFALNSGVFGAIDLADAATTSYSGTPLFVQVSDTHIGFKQEANPDVAGTLSRSIALINALPNRPGFAIHTGDITHLSKAEEFDIANQLLSQLRVSEMHAVPGEHDVTDGPGTEFFKRFGKPSNGKGYYSFDANGVHFAALVNVMSFKAGGLGALGDDQLSWLKDDLAGRSASQPVVLFAHMPLWTIYEPWGWGTGEGDQVAALVKRFGSVTVLNGHIHQIVQKVEGNITFHTARSTAYPQPAAGVGPGPGPLTVPPDQLARMLGVTSVAVARANTLALTDFHALLKFTPERNWVMASRRLAFALPLLAVAFSGASAVHADDSNIVTIKNFDYAPMSLTVSPGSTVTWKNLDGEPHTVVSIDGAFRSQALDQNDTFSFKFDKPGTYKYVCSIHPMMIATITVK